MVHTYPSLYGTVGVIPCFTPVVCLPFPDSALTTHTHSQEWVTAATPPGASATSPKPSKTSYQASLSTASAQAPPPNPTLLQLILAMSTTRSPQSAANSPPSPNSIHMAIQLLVSARGGSSLEPWYRDVSILVPRLRY